MKRRAGFFLRLSGWIAVAVALALCVGGWSIYGRITRVHGLPGGEPVIVEIPRGSSATGAARILERARVIEDARLLSYLLRLTGKAARIGAGHYRFDGPLSLLEVADRLVRGDVELLPVLVREGADRWDIARALEDSGICSSQALLNAMAGVDGIRDLDPEAEDLEGYLFPDTYRFSRETDPGSVLRAMVQRFKGAVQADWLPRASEMGMTLRDVVILASIIEKETGDASERELISSVFHNRLGKGIQLASDPTIIYFLKLQGVFDGNLKRVHLKTPSPYNTYLNRGLPPGPVSNPGEEALKAALYPAQTDFYYFVSMNNGKHAFSRNLKEHNRAVKEYQKDYFRDRWRRQRAQ